MKIEEIVKLYDLISNISWLGLFGIILFAWSIILLTLIILFKEKESTFKKTILQYGTFAALFVAGALVLFKIDADNKKDLISKANRLKSIFLNYNYSYIGYNRIKHFDKYSKFTNETLEKLIQAFPDEFIKESLEDPIEYDTVGIRLIDIASIEKINEYNLTHIPFLKETIRHYMITNNIDSLTYNDVRVKIDIYFDNEWIELMLSHYDSIFSPFSSNDPSEWYDTNHGFKLKKKI